MNTKILFVDDDPNLLDGIQRNLRKQFNVDTASSGEEGLRRISLDGPYSVIVADMQMPVMSGLEFLREVQNQAPDSVRMMLTGNSDLKTAVDAVNDSRVFSYLTKPCPPPVLAPALTAALEQYRLMHIERDLLENTLGGAIKVLTEILSLIDPATFDRSQKLKEYVRDFTSSWKVSRAWELEFAAMLAQIGRVTVPPGVIERLHDGFALTGPEKDILHRVPEFGARLLENIPRLENVANIVRYQDKHYDGTGLPSDSIAGEEIPIGARILKVLGDFIEIEASSVSRPAALARMQERLGWYDLTVLAAVSRWCDVALGALSGEGAAPVAVPIDELRVGQVLAQDVRTSGGLLIVAVHTRLTAILLAKLVNFRNLNSIEHTLLAYSELDL